MVNSTNHMDTGICCSSSDDKFENLTESGKNHKIHTKHWKSSSLAAQNSKTVVLLGFEMQRKNSQEHWIHPIHTTSKGGQWWGQEIMWQMHITHCKREANLSMLHSFNRWIRQSAGETNNENTKHNSIIDWQWWFGSIEGHVTTSNWQCHVQSQVWCAQRSRCPRRLPHGNASLPFFRHIWMCSWLFFGTIRATF